MDSMAKRSDTSFAFVDLLKACAKQKDLCEGIRLHDDILKLGLIAKNPYISSSLISMYAKCGWHAKAQQVLDELSVRDVVAWNALIAGHVQQGQARAALNYFEHMKIEGISPDVTTFICILKASGKERDIDKGKQIHDEIVNKGLLEKDSVLGTALVDMYAKFGMLKKAHRVLEELPHRDAISWNALITGYAQEGQGHEVLNCFEWMQSEGFCPDAITYICILKACGSIGDIDRGKQIHEQIGRIGLLQRDVVLGTTLVDMYAKCGVLVKAQDALDELPLRTVVSWNALIAGHCQDGQGYEALNCLQQMKNEGIFPDAVTFLSMLKACSITGAIDKAKQIHNEILCMGLLKIDIMVGNGLVDMYAKCGLLTKAQKLVEELSLNNLVTFNSLLAAYAQHGQGHEALNCFEQMLNNGHTPDVVTFICILKACGSIKAIDMGIQVHDEVMARGLLQNNIVLGNALLDMYAKCGELTKAQEVLEQLPIRDVVSWNVLIAGYAQDNQGHEVLKCFERMQTEGHFPDPVTFICVLKACGSTGAIGKGKQIHDLIISRHMLQKDIKLGTVLVDMYANCGMLAKAQQMFKELPLRDVVSWNALIRGHAQEGHGHGALDCFEQMKSEGISPDAVTFLLILSVCSSTGDIGKGESFHEEIVNMGLQKDIVLGNALVDMYAKCGFLEKAHKTLKELPNRNIVTWSALITGYAQHGQGHEALNCFNQMQNEGLAPDIVTFICVLKCCGNITALEKGEQIHYEILSKGLLKKNTVLGTSLIDMYAKCGVLTKAKDVLEEILVRDVISWNAMISAYAQHRQGHEALNCFQRMESEGFAPDVVTFICILMACGSTGAIEKGHQIHEKIVSGGFLEKDVMVGAALVDMYAKCGMFTKAKKLLQDLPIRNTICWNALIAGYAKQGLGREALTCFEQMQREGFSPDDITFLCILTSCSHSGQLDEAQEIFGDMSIKYGINPSIEHLSCIVIALGCAGHFDKALAVIKAMPSSDYLAVWIALLRACRKWGNVELGRLAFDQTIQLNSSCSLAYVFMANIFADAGMKEDEEKVEAMRLKYAAFRKQETDVWTDDIGNVHSSFTAG